MEEQKDYIAEAKRIAEDIKATEEHILELDREEKFQKKHVEDLKVQYKEVFIKANIDRLTAFKEECKKHRSCDLCPIGQKIDGKNFCTKPWAWVDIE